MSKTDFPSSELRPTPLSDLNELFGITSPPTYGNYDFYCDDEAPKRCSECMDSLGEQKKCSGELTSTQRCVPKKGREGKQTDESVSMLVPYQKPWDVIIFR